VSEPVLRLKNVSVSFGSQPVLRDLTLDIAAGDTVAVIGESGCGKTVLLKLIVGLLAPTSGSIYFGDQEVQSLGEKQLADLRRRIGFLFQSAALFDSLTVFDNIAFGLRAKGGHSESDIQNRVAERLSDVGLVAATAAKMPAELSGGMKKRVGLARALALDPEVMLYDEPTTGLDPIMTDTINDLILQTRKKRPLTSLVVSHEMRTVNKVADRVVMLEPLRRLKDGEPQVIYDGPADRLRESKDQRVRNFVEGVATKDEE
jgi:phospholipid/cholesterol/gamma-HCH transport system ATP-binding protein